jgi:phage tail tape-measure protein
LYRFSQGASAAWSALSEAARRYHRRSQRRSEARRPDAAGRGAIEARSRGDRGAIEAHTIDAHTIDAHKKKAHVTVRLEMAALLPLLLLDTPFSWRLAAHRD